MDTEIRGQETVRSGVGERGAVRSKSWCHLKERTRLGSKCRAECEHAVLRQKRHNAPATKSNAMTNSKRLWLGRQKPSLWI